MATFTKMHLSGSESGRPISVTNNIPSGVVHQSSNNASVIDEVWIYCHNIGSSDEELELIWGDPTMQSLRTTVYITIPSQSGLVLVAPGLLISNNNKISARTQSSSSGLAISGYVNRIE